MFQEEGTPRGILRRRASIFLNYHSRRYASEVLDDRPTLTSQSCESLQKDLNKESFLEKKKTHHVI